MLSRTGPGHWQAPDHQFQAKDVRKADVLRDAAAYPAEHQQVRSYHHVLALGLRDEISGCIGCRRHGSPMRGLRPTAGDTSHKADSMFVRHLASQPLVQNTGAIVEERCRPKRFVRAGNHIAPGCSAIHRPGAMCHSKLLGEVGYAYVGDLHPATSSVLRNITFSPADPRSLLPESDDLRCHAGSGFTGGLVSGVRTGSPREGTRLVDRCSPRQGQPGSASDLEAAVRHRSCSRSRLERLPRFGESPRCRRRCMRCGA